MNPDQDSVFKGRASKTVRATFTGTLAFLWCLWPSIGAFAASPHGTLVGSRVVSDTVLDSMRGGFSFGDADFNFSFRSITWINNVFQAETDLTLANNIITSVNKIINSSISHGSNLGPTGTTSNSSVIQGSGLGPTGTTNNSSVIQGSGLGPIGTTNTGSSGTAGNQKLTDNLSTVIGVGSGNSGVTGNSLSNGSPLTTVIQNNANNVVIQHLTQINGIINNSGSMTHAANMVIRLNQASTLGSILSRF